MLFFITITSYSQEFKFGIKGSLNITGTYNKKEIPYVLGKDTTNLYSIIDGFKYEYNRRPGFCLGGFFYQSFMASNFLGVQAEVGINYKQINSLFEWTNAQATLDNGQQIDVILRYTYNYAFVGIDFPLLLVVNFKGILIRGGGFGTYNFSSKVATNWFVIQKNPQLALEENPEDFSKPSYLNKLEYGYLFDFGYQFKNGLAFTCRYNKDLSFLMHERKFEFDDKSLKLYTFQITVSKTLE